MTMFTLLADILYCMAAIVVVGIGIDVLAFVLLAGLALAVVLRLERRA